MAKKQNEVEVWEETPPKKKRSGSYSKTKGSAYERQIVNELKKLNVDSSRLKSRGYGESQPIASNDTAEGKALNRRVTALVNK